jgi:hypothetical protein
LPFFVLPVVPLQPTSVPRLLQRCLLLRRLFALVTPYNAETELKLRQKANDPPFQTGKTGRVQIKWSLDQNLKRTVPP